MLLPSAFYVLLQYPAVTKVTTLVKQNYSQKNRRISIFFMQKSCRFYWIFDLFLIYIIVAILLIINDLSIYIMSKVKSQFPTGNFYLRGGKDGNGVIHIRYFIIVVDLEIVWEPTAGCVQRWTADRQRGRPHLESEPKDFAGLPQQRHLVLHSGRW